MTSSGPNYLTKVPASNTITWTVRTSTCEFGEDTIQLIKTLNTSPALRAATSRPWTQTVAASAGNVPPSSDGNGAPALQDRQERPLRRGSTSLHLEPQRGLWKAGRLPWREPQEQRPPPTGAHSPSRTLAASGTAESH